MLGVYELKRVQLLRNVFDWLYERSAARYAAQRQSMGEPIPFRLRRRVELRVMSAMRFVNAFRAGPGTVHRRSAIRS